MDLTIQTQNFSGGDYTWLGSEFGTCATKSATLNASLFTTGTHAPNGYYPSGLPLGKVTATGLYGPYKPAASDGTQNLAGFLFGDVALSRTGANVQGAVLEVGIINTAKVPIITVDATAQATNGHFIYR
jgi:hypothetical protein